VDNLNVPSGRRVGSSESLFDNINIQYDFFSFMTVYL